VGEGKQKSGFQEKTRFQSGEGIKKPGFCEQIKSAGRPQKPGF
jgi:hypothetical protein